MKQFEDINYSIWCDFIERDFLENRFQEIINDEIIKGATSNPAIFESSITSSGAYEQQLLILQANDNKAIYEELAFTDIKRAAEILEPLYSNNSDNGFISIEVDPLLCDDAEATISEGLRISKYLNADNVMIKIPATQAGYIAMKELTSKGIHVNATLIFSVEQAIECAKALDEGIKASNKNIKAVVSVFVSRFDRAIDSDLILKGLTPSKLGIINATKCYHEIEKFGNKNIRTLFASTGVKGNGLSPTYYIDNLIYPNSINTAPLSTIEEWIKDGKKEACEILSEAKCDEYFEELSKEGFNVDEISKKLLEDGLESFKVSFKELLEKVKN
ncbi:Transaldolase [Aliarcobacter thereius]|uniref:Transaldolase n=2 Tax=Aliarcobacter thereius TaxID=544718 RepID=A0A1C0B9K8_9BACT|nr:transaldolase [Aliarcobacter thereius]OCL88606.1 Transaldolase [Aliarcobacter thereius]OCL92100.1 Transaldolase [Aliarcobacter thereius]OCL94804.1 Transaldolase [Aliarcobacter thereius LMG 24486]OCM00251.1 Transaldolase [Aliarcobacter thereius]QBF15321.1 transaldolase [Aliarcobacter thereius LMG 24486]